MWVCCLKWVQGTWSGWPIVDGGVVRVLSHLSCLIQLNPTLVHFLLGTVCVGRCEHSKGTWAQNNWNGSKMPGLFYKFELKWLLYLQCLPHKHIWLMLLDVPCYKFKPVRQQLRRKSNTCTTCTSTSTTSTNTSSISSTRCEYVDLHYVIPQLPTFVLSCGVYINNNYDLFSDKWLWGLNKSWVCSAVYNLNDPFLKKKKSHFDSSFVSSFHTLCLFSRWQR